MPWTACLVVQAGHVLIGALDAYVQTFSKTILYLLPWFLPWSWCWKGDPYLSASLYRLLTISMLLLSDMRPQMFYIFSWLVTMKIVFATELEVKLWPDCIVVQAGLSLTSLLIYVFWHIACLGLTATLDIHLIIVLLLRPQPACILVQAGLVLNDVHCICLWAFLYWLTCYDDACSSHRASGENCISQQWCAGWSRSHCCSCDLPSGALYILMMIIVLIYSSNSENLIRLHSCASVFGWLLLWPKS